MTRVELLKEIKKRNPDVWKDDIPLIVDSFLEVVKENMIKGEPTWLQFFGTFKIVYRKERLRANPFMKPTLFPATNFPSIKFSKEIVDAVKKGRVGF